MKCFFQLLSQETGLRSAAIGMDRTDFVTLLKMRLESNPEISSDYVLVLVDDVANPEWSFSSAPLLTVTNFITAFGPVPPFNPASGGLSDSF